MNENEINKHGEVLRKKMLLFGAGKQRSACRKLADDSGALAVPYLAEALQHPDAEVKTIASAALRSLKKQEAVDALCNIWFEKRNADMGKLIAECRHVASGPMDIRVLSALKANRPEIGYESEEALNCLVRVLDDSDKSLQNAADSALRKISDRYQADLLCEMAIQNPGGKIAKICIETGMRPILDEQHCLFLFVTRQLDEYFKTDHNFMNLRAAYDRSGPVVRGFVMDVVRTGDKRCLAFFGGERKPLIDCTADEISLAIDTALRHKDYDKLFLAFLDLPMRMGFGLLGHFRNSGWEPKDPDVKKMYIQALEDTKDAVFVPSVQEKEKSSYFESCMAKGNLDEYKNSNPEKLMEGLDNFPSPEEAIAAVTALSGNANPDGELAKKVKDHPNWLVRITAYMTGLCKLESGQGSVKEDNYWINQLIVGSKHLALWPEKATPEDLKELNSAPAEAWIGKIGAMRKVLKGVLTLRTTAPDLKPVTIDAGEFSVTLIAVE